MRVYIFLLIIIFIIIDDKRNFIIIANCEVNQFYCTNPKTVNTRIFSGTFLCCEEKANQMQDEKNTSCNDNLLCGLRFFICYLIGHHTNVKVKSKTSRFLDSHSNSIHMYLVFVLVYNKVQ